MKCNSCGLENPDDSKFCEGCGGSLSGGPAPVVAPPTPAATSTLQCPSCKAMNPQDSQFCDSCGASLSAAGPAPAPPVPVPPVPPVAPTPTVKAAFTMPDNSEMVLTGSDTIGRTRLAKFITEADKATEISRKHLIITTEGMKFFIEDGGSTNGTKLNNVEIKDSGKQELKNGDIILVADLVELVFKI